MKERFSHLVPLAIFTSLVIGAVGLAWGVAASRCWSEGTSPTQLHALWTTLGLLAAAGLSATLHLSHPTRSRHVFRGLPHSGLSREILFLTGFTAAVALSIWACASGVAHLSAASLIATSALGLATLWTITALYALPAQPRWSSPWFRLSPFIQSAFMGAMLSPVLASEDVIFEHAPALIGLATADVVQRAQDVCRPRIQIWMQLGDHLCRASCVDAMLDPRPWVHLGSLR